MMLLANNLPEHFTINIGQSVSQSETERGKDLKIQQPIQWICQ